MGAADIRLRMATQDDAQTVASIITTVSEGVIEYLLGDLFPGMTPEKILEMILIRGSGNLNLSNVLLVDVGGMVSWHLSLHIAWQTVLTRVRVF